jgi:ADP-ribose pyrophosphatase
MTTPMRPGQREVLGEGRFLRLVREGRWEFAERTNARGAVAIVAVTKDRRLVLTEQYRPAVGANVIDLPAGLSGDVAGEEDEAEAASARRELAEETGYTAKRVKQLVRCTTTPGLASEIVTYFLARNVEHIGDGGGVGHERITVHAPKLSAIGAWLKRQAKAGTWIDSKVYAGLYFAGR